MKVQIKYPKTKCSYCGKTFTKTHNRQTYCSDHCRTEARREKRRRYNYKYYTNNKQKIHQKYIGTGTLAPKPNPNTEREREIIQNEIERIGLRIF
jgi:predicted nucleic acid-binding Zn ribbon protein